MHSTFTDVAGLQGTTSLCCGVQGILGREGEHMFCIDVTWTSTFSCLFIYYHVLWNSYMSFICCGRAATFALWRVTAKVATCESSALMSLIFLVCYYFVCYRFFCFLKRIWLLCLIVANFWPDWVVMSMFWWVCFANTVHLVKGQCYQTLLGSWEMHITFLWLQGWRD